MFIIFDVLRDLVTFLQFKKREKHPWKSVTFNKVAGKWHQIAQRINEFVHDKLTLWGNFVLAFLSQCQN